MATHTIAIQGVAGAYHDIAARRYFGAAKGDTVEIVECDTFDQLCEAVTNNTASAGMMAIENTIAGSILPNYALLQTYNLSVIGETYVRIQHNLLALPGQSIKDIHTVQAHPMALLQCRDFFAKYPHIHVEEAFDTAGIAKKIRNENISGLAAIAGYLAADLYKLDTLAEGLESNKQNFTRFLAISRTANHVSREFNKASIGFRVSHTSGTLADALAIFKRNGINLTKIQSIPVIGVPYEYTIHVDMTWEDTSDFEQALREFKPEALELKVFGVYKEGEKNIDLTTKHIITVNEPNDPEEPQEVLETAKKQDSGEMTIPVWQNWIPPAPNTKSNYLLISGPCSAETEEQVLETARRIAATGKASVYRAGVWKPRTRAGGFEGHGVKALQWLKRAKEETGLMMAVEVATAQHVEDCLRHGIDILWIGARTTGNPFSVQEIADAARGTDVGMMVKNPISPDLELWMGAMERVYRVGINKLIAIHRGFSTHEKSVYRNNPTWAIPMQFRARLPQMPLINDPSHITGKRALLAGVAQKAIDLGMDGFIIESHIDPDNAWTDAAQQVTPEALAEMLNSLTWQPAYGSVTHDDTSKLDTLRSAIDRLDAEFMDLLAARMNIVREIGEYKKHNNLDVLQPARWEEIIQKRLAQGGKLGLGDGFVREVFSNIHKESLTIQQG
ncbi:MAG: chorismate mutase [Candidatus Kapabacteria bacterium]|nr:chorismate mutase [Candidatus Kapabacteria bacterium]